MMSLWEIISMQRHLVILIGYTYESSKLKKEHLERVAGFDVCYYVVNVWANIKYQAYGKGMINNLLRIWFVIPKQH